MPAKTTRTHTPKAFDTVTSELDAMSTDLKGVAQAMRDCGLETLDVDGYASLVKGLTGLRIYCTKAREAMSNHRLSGDIFRVGEPESARKPKKVGR